MKSKFMILTAAFGLAVTSSRGALIFEEDFGSLADGTTITTSNTNFTYVRTSTGTGAADPDIVNPANVGTGSSGYIESPSGSLTGIGVGNTLTSSNVYTLSVDFRFTNVTSGDIVFGVGAGTAFTVNGTFSTSQGLFWVQSDSGNLERRTSSAWSNVGSGITLANNTNYSLHIVANGSAGSLNYGTSDSVAAGTMDIWFNGVLVDDDVTVTTNGLSADGFRFYSINGTGMEVDNIKLWNEATAIPEPSSIIMVGLVGLAALAVLRKRK